MMLAKITDLVNDYVDKFPDAELYDEAGKKVLKSFGRNFLNQSTPTFIYYSHYLTPEVDNAIVSLPTLRQKPTNLKRTADMIKKNVKTGSKDIRKKQKLS